MKYAIKVFGSIYHPDSLMGTPDQDEVAAFLNTIGDQFVTIFAVGTREVWVVYDSEAEIDLERRADDEYFKSGASRGDRGAREC